jgi:hypothetical protein
MPAKAPYVERSTLDRLSGSRVIEHWEGRAQCRAVVATDGLVRSGASMRDCHYSAI